MITLFCEKTVALYIGLMSGTSMDGIDAALVEIPSNKLTYGITKKYSDKVRCALNDVMSNSQIGLAQLCQLNTLIGRDFAGAVHQLLEESGYSSTQIKAIGSHGQTVCHDITAVIPYTLQMGCGHTISTLTGIDVVADFRTRDIVNGGQGAPFAPLYHQELFAKYQEESAIVNIGGIANVTFLNPKQRTRGWDVGPGNCLMDAWINIHLGKNYDDQGQWGSQGKVIPCLLNNLLADPFFSQAYPKSIGKEYFSLSWLDKHLSPNYLAVDVQATLAALTAWCIAESIRLTNNGTKKLYVCGGGTHNNQLLHNLTQLIPTIEVTSVRDLDVDPDYLEAMMFAWFASQTINLIPVDFRAITGSTSRQILGAIYPSLPK
jgi:anhydro-N-acetylmuramic acid kinase